MKSLDEIRRIKTNAESELFNIPGVNGVGIGYKKVGGQDTDEMSIRVYVNKKKNVPDNEQIPSEISGVKTDVIEREGTAVPYYDTKIYPSLEGGICIGRADLDIAGTIGAIVKDNFTNSIALLSCFHVLAVNSTAKEGVPISQPANTPSNKVARLHKFDLSVDAATAIVYNPGNTLHRIEGIGGTVTGVADVMHGSHVRKRGISTLLTEGIIDSTDNSVLFDYSKLSPDMPKDWLLTNQLIIESVSFSDEGDSGSALIDDSGKMVGLLTGGNKKSGQVYATAIQNVLYSLQCTICKVNWPC
jgi:Equine arteritis virus serine endopeptidase S32